MALCLKNQNIKSLDSHITQSCLEHKSQFDLDMKPFPALGPFVNDVTLERHIPFILKKVNDIDTLTIHFLAEWGYSLPIEYNDSIKG